MSKENVRGMQDDTISREQAIDAVRATLLAWSYMPEWRDNKIIEAVKRLPPIQPKRGKWIEIEAFDDSRYVKCDQCKTVQVFYYGKRNTNFCPNCGADMRGEQDG